MSATIRQIRTCSIIMIVVMMVGMVAFMQYVMYEQNRAVEDAIRQAEEGPARETQALSPATVKEILGKVEGDWLAAEIALRDGEYLAARKHANQARDRMRDLHYGAGGSEIEPGVTVDERGRALEDGFVEVLQEHFETMLEDLRRAAIAPYLIRSFIRDYSDIGLQERFDEVRTEIAALRTRRAHGWLRVTFSEARSAYTVAIAEQLRANWSEESDWTLVFGRALDDQERNATGMTLHIRIDEKQAAYSNAQLGRYEIPEGVNLEFKLTKKYPARTSWDALFPLAVRQPVPEHFDVTNTEAWTQMDAERTAHRETLLTALQTQLNGLPAFTLESAPQARERVFAADGTIDPEQAYTLAFADRTAFIKLLLEKLPNVAPKQRREYAELIVQAEVNEAESWILDGLKLETRGERRAICDALRKRPWYGDFRPLLMWMRSGESAHERAQAVYALKGQLVDESVQSAVRDLIATCKPEMRRGLIGFYCQEVPLSELLNRLDWLRDADPDVAQEVARVIRNRSPLLCEQAILLHLDKMPLAAQKQLLVQYPLDPQSHLVTELIRAMQASAQASDDPGLAELIVQVLTKHVANLPAGWMALHALQSLLTDEREQKSLRRTLMYAVQEAHPEYARDFLLQQMRTGDTDDLREAAHNVMQIKGHDREVLQAILNRMEAEKGDGKLVESLLFSVSKGISSGAVTEFDDGTVVAMALLAAGHEERGARWRAANLLGTILGRAKDADEKEYIAQMMEAMLLTESDKGIREKLVKRLNHYKKQRNNAGNP